MSQQTKFGISQPVKRVEDLRFITGQGRYVDDIQPSNTTYAYFVRSTLAHAKILSIGIEDALAVDGVLDIIIGSEFAEHCINNIPCNVGMENRDGTKLANPGRPVICTDEVKFVGDTVAVVIAESALAAKNAAELVLVDYDELGVSASTKTTMDEGQPCVHDEVPNNICLDWSFGDQDKVLSAFDKAAHVVTLELINNRVIVNSMESRAVIAEYRSKEDKIRLHTNTQGGWTIKNLVANALKIEANQIQVLTPDVGGGFGMKCYCYPEHMATAYAARKLNRSVKWTAERSDAFLTDTQGRDHVTTAKLALDSEYRILALHVHTIANFGAYLSQFAPFIPTLAALKVLPGVYQIEQCYYHVHGVFTHTTPVDAYRGAGRPESIYMIERLIEKASYELAISPIELRTRNFIRVDQMPYRTAVGEIYDSGDFKRVMDQALLKADYKGFSERAKQSVDKGKRRGIGMAYYIESTMGSPREDATIRFTEDNYVEVLVGTQSNGQGHETAYTQIVHQQLGVPFDAIRIIQGDTDEIPYGGGTGGSRSVTAQGWALGSAVEEVVKQAKQLASEELEVAVEDIDFEAGEFSIVGTDRSIHIMQLAQLLSQNAQNVGPALSAYASINVGAYNYPNGCHIVEVEVDPQTGVVEILRYTVVDDFGEVINPLLLAGQVHGGIVQGMGQALGEIAVYDDYGQLLTGSFMDYGMPRADDTPFIDFNYLVIPCKTNPLGMKGCGEAGTVGACPAIVNSVINALHNDGIIKLDMPLTPAYVWGRLQNNGVNIVNT